MKKILTASMTLRLSAVLCAGCSSGADNEGKDMENPAAGSENGANADSEAGIGNQNEDTQEPVMIQTFAKEDVAVTPEIKEYDFAAAEELGETQQLRGTLPGAAEGVWHIVSIEGVEYYYGKYDFDEDKEAEFFGYAIFSDSYSLHNGITVGMTMEEILGQYPNMAVMDFEGNYLGQEIVYMGWDTSVYPHSYIWQEGGKDYQWSDQFDCIMLADIDLGTAAARPVCLALLVKDGAVAAITFSCPAGGIVSPGWAGESG